MAEIAVAVLDVHEVVAAGLGTLCGRHEVLDQALDVVIRHHRVIGGQAEFPVEDGMVVEDDRLQGAAGVGAAEPPGMGELEADEQRAGVAALRFLVGCGEGAAEGGDVAHRVPRRQ